MNGSKESYKKGFGNWKKNPGTNFINEYDWSHDKFNSGEQGYQNPRNPNDKKYHQKSRGGAFYQENMNWAHDKFNDLEREFTSTKNFKKKKRGNEGFSNDARKDAFYHNEKFKNENENGNNNRNNNSNQTNDYNANFYDNSGPKTQTVELFINSDGCDSSITLNLDKEEDIEELVDLMLEDKGLSL